MIIFTVTAISEAEEEENILNSVKCFYKRWKESPGIFRVYQMRCIVDYVKKWCNCTVMVRTVARMPNAEAIRFISKSRVS